MQREDKDITELLGSLGSVEAPEGFETRVMKSVVEGRRAEKLERPVTLLVIKFAAPALLLFIVGAFFVFFADSDVNTALVPPVHEGEIRTFPQVDMPENIGGTAAATTPSVSQPESAEPKDAPRKAGPPRSSQGDIVSEDFAVKGPGETYMPPGFDPDRRNANSLGDAPNRGAIRLGDALAMIGISASCRVGGCSITSVRIRSIADRSGMSAGDRIVSIDGRAVKSDTSFNGQASFRTFQIFRNGDLINISLSAK